MLCLHLRSGHLLLLCLLLWRVHALLLCLLLLRGHSLQCLPPCKGHVLFHHRPSGRGHSQLQCVLLSLLSLCLLE